MKNKHLILIIFIFNIIVAFAVENKSINNTNSQMYSEIQNDFHIIVPKQITFNGATKTATYNIKCESYNESIEYISIIPDSTFEMSQINKNNIVAKINQPFNTFVINKNNEELKENETLITNTIVGTITAPELTAGFWQGNFSFNITIKEKGYTDFILDANNINKLGINSLKGDIIIPEFFEYENITYRVTKISENAFQYQTEITSINLPKSVIEIGDYAFVNCTSLKSINIPNNAIIGKYAFQYCSSLFDVIFDGKIKEIKEGAFYSCTGLKSIDIPENIIIINNSTFYNCSGLNKITLPTTLEIIDTKAFAYCTNLIDIALPKSLITLGEESFYNCVGTTLHIPDSVITIGRNAFTYIQKIYYSGTATYEKDNIYWGASSLN